MKLTKMFGLVLLAVAAMAVLGASTAAAKDNVVLCKKEVTGANLCPAGELYPKDTTITATAVKPVLLGSLNVECPESTVTLLTAAETGPTLKGSVTGLTFGPAGSCSGCTTVDTAPPYAASIEVNASDEFSLNTKGSATLLHCLGFFNVTCVYGAESVIGKVENKTNGLPTVTIVKQVLTKKAGSAGICPETGEWDATYTTTSPKFWVALDVEAPEK